MEFWFVAGFMAHPLIIAAAMGLFPKFRKWKEEKARAWEEAVTAVHSHDRSTPFPKNPYREKN